MNDLLQAVTSDFGFIATSTEFRFHKYCESVDWEGLDKIDIDDIVTKTDVQSLSTLVASILSYNIEKMSVSKKVFRLSQLIIDFLLHFKKQSTFIFNNKVKRTALCEFCGKMFADVNYLKYHCFRRHGVNSCTSLNLSENEHIKNLKLEIVQLQTNLEEMSLAVKTKSQNSEIHLGENNRDTNCNAVHKNNKLLYRLIPLSGDNPMQIQEMYWKQKYNDLEKNYITLKNEYEKEQNTAKIKTVLHHKYQQCERSMYTDEKSSKYVQTESLIETTTSLCSPHQTHQKADVISEKEIHPMDILDIDKSKPECRRLNGDKSSDKDYSELIKLRQEASMNIIENKTGGDYEFPEPLLHSDYVNQIQIVLTLGQIRADDLLKNNYLIDLIKYDVKDLVHKRLLEFYSPTTEIDEYSAILQEQVKLYSSRECEVSDYSDIKIEKHGSLNIDCKPSEKKKNTFMSKFKNKFHKRKLSSPDSKNKKTERTSN